MEDPTRRFDLQTVVEATSRDDFQLGGSRCLHILLTYLDDLATCRSFVREIASELTEGDFCARKTLESPTGGSDDFDEYGLEVSNDVLDRYGLQDAAWYVKFTVREGQWGEQVFYLSVHPLEKPMEREAGWLSPHQRIHS